MESGEICPPIQNLRGQRACNQNRQLKYSGELKERFHTAPIAFINGKMTLRTNGGWKSQNTGTAVITMVKI